MNITCAALATTLKSLTVAASIAVSGTCPAYVDLLYAPKGTTIDFTAAPLVRLDVQNLSKITLKGIVASGSQYSGMNVIASQGILIVAPQIDHPGTAGITITRSDSVEVQSPLITHSLGDGIDISGSTNINVHDGACQDNIRTTTHPDCVQIWSLPGYQIQHIAVQRMQVTGQTQGIDDFGDTAGSSDINILNNVLSITEANCISFTSVTGLNVSNNQCISLPGGTVGPAVVRIFSSPGAVVSNNISS